MATSTSAWCMRERPISASSSSSQARRLATPVSRSVRACWRALAMNAAIMAAVKASAATSVHPVKPTGRPVTSSHPCSPTQQAMASPAITRVSRMLE